MTCATSRRVATVVFFFFLSFSRLYRLLVLWWGAFSLFCVFFFRPWGRRCLPVEIFVSASYRTTGPANWSKTSAGTPTARKENIMVENQDAKPPCAPVLNGVATPSPPPTRPSTSEHPSRTVSPTTHHPPPNPQPESTRLARSSHPLERLGSFLPKMKALPLLGNHVPEV